MLCTNAPHLQYVGSLGGRSIRIVVADTHFKSPTLVGGLAATSSAADYDN